MDNLELTLDDLHLKPNQVADLHRMDKLQRQALFDACTHIVYTSYKLESRQAALRLREHIRKLTLDDHGTNKCKFDTTVNDEINNKLDDE